MAPRRQAAPEGSMPPPSRPSSPGGEEIEETPFFDNVDELQQHGINVQDILKLKRTLERLHQYCVWCRDDYASSLTENKGYVGSEG
ncbi:hypothetical protein BDR05DRAFT_47954 [Suillus weaverae]|nr:hypothetical protein BDR05DRAFT_47954 [Suillus weaverae]